MGAEVDGSAICNVVDVSGLVVAGGAEGTEGIVQIEDTRVGSGSAMVTRSNIIMSANFRDIETHHCRCLALQAF